MHLLVHPHAEAQQMAGGEAAELVGMQQTLPPGNRVAEGQHPDGLETHDSGAERRAAVEQFQLDRLAVRLRLEGRRGGPQRHDLQPRGAGNYDGHRHATEAGAEAAGGEARAGDLDAPAWADARGDDAVEDRLDGQRQRVRPAGAAHHHDAVQPGRHLDDTEAKQGRQQHLRRALDGTDTNPVLPPESPTGGLDPLRRIRLPRNWRCQCDQERSGLDEVATPVQFGGARRQRRRRAEQWRIDREGLADARATRAQALAEHAGDFQAGTGVEGR